MGYFDTSDILQNWNYYLDNPSEFRFKLIDFTFSDKEIFWENLNEQQRQELVNATNDEDLQILWDRDVENVNEVSKMETQSEGNDLTEQLRKKENKIQSLNRQLQNIDIEIRRIKSNTVMSGFAEAIQARKEEIKEKENEKQRIIEEIHHEENQLMQLRRIIEIRESTKQEKLEEENVKQAEKISIFISHSVKQKEKAHSIKEELQKDGVFNCFVAHDDIKPTQVWQTKIEEELNKTDLIIGLISKEFNDSHWCQQEMGWALGRGIPYITILLDDEGIPEAFINKKQAMKWSNWKKDIIQSIIETGLITNSDLVLP